MPSLLGFGPRHRTDRFAFPVGTAPGFNMSHPASKNVRISFVGTGQNILSGKGPSVTGTSTVNNPTRIGPAYLGIDATSGLTFPDTLSPAPKNFFTAAVIFIPTDVTLTSRTLVASRGIPEPGNFSILLRQLNPGGIDLRVQGTVSMLDNFPALTNNVPYFYATSAFYDSVNTAYLHNHIGVRLDTGQRWSFSGVTAGGVPLQGTETNSYSIGDLDGVSGFFGYIAAAMMNLSYVSLAELIAWGNDPWAFWYPDAAVDDFAVGTIITAGARFRRTLSQIGTRTGSRQTMMVD